MSKNDLLSQMRNLLLKSLNDNCISHSIEFDRGRASFSLKNGTIIHIRYNNYGQYSYMLQFSSKKLDRVRFDNYDENWEVSTKPHHQHIRHKNTVQEAKTIGDPEKDFEIILETLRNETALL